ncbi:T9SS type A sorting domain-containing protein [bacterium]|nr:T9SS type A sorting domain-containing protein [bacterium]
MLRSIRADDSKSIIGIINLGETMRNLTLALLLGIILLSTSANAQLLNNPESVVYDSARHCYLVSNWAENSGEIVRIDSNGTQTYFSTALQGQYQIAGLYIYGDTLLAAAGNAPDAGVAGFSLETGELLYFIVIPGIGLPNDITSDTSGIIYLTDYWGDKLYKIIDRTPYVFMTANLGNPNGIMYDELYNRLLIVSVTRPGSPILQVALEDSVLSMVTQTGLSGGDGIAMDDERNVYLCEWTHDRIYTFDSTFTVGPEVFSTGHNDPADFYFDRVNQVLAVPNFSGNSVDFIPIIPSAIWETVAVEIPQNITLYQNWPNPFNPFTVIRFHLNEPGFVSLKVYNLLGQEIATLLSGMKTAGTQTITFNGKDLPSGIYLYRLETDDFAAQKKMLLLK